MIIVSPRLTMVASLVLLLTACSDPENDGRRVIPPGGDVGIVDTSIPDTSTEPDVIVVPDVAEDTAQPPDGGEPDVEELDVMVDDAETDTGGTDAELADTADDDAHDASDGGEIDAVADAVADAVEDIVEDIVEDPEPAKISFSTVYSTVIAGSCTGCHGGSGGLDMSTETLALQNLFQRESLCGMGGVIRVVPFEPENSFLWQKVGPGITASCGMKMPFGSQGLTGDAAQLVHDWIADGALP